MDPIAQIDDICDRFEDAWLAGTPASIEAVLASADAAIRVELLKELLRLDIEYRRKRDPAFSLQEYRSRFPEADTWLVSLADKEERKPTVRPTVRLSVISGPNQGRQFTFDRHETFLLGRSQDAHCSLPGDAYLSRHHFMIEVNPPLCRLVDLASHNGTKVNGQRVEVVDLKNGDKIEVGVTGLIIGISFQTADEEAHWDVDTIKPVPRPAMNAADDPPSVPGYRMLGKLGQGGMGVVYRAVSESSGEVVALKTLRLPALPPMDDGEMDVTFARFLRESRLLRSLSHPNIVGYRDCGHVGDHLYFTMELIEGTDAAALLARHGPFPIGAAVRLMGHVLEALSYAHSRNVVHRDLKPANIMVADNGARAVVTDFGLARAWGESNLSQLTVTGDLAGTPAFMPPEQILNFHTVTPAGDQYAAAATLYALLAGQPPFPLDCTAQELFKWVLEKTPQRLETRRPEISPPLAAVVHQALDRDPKRRFVDVREFSAALQPFADGMNDQQ